jgi:hypothetical protein
MTRRLCPSLPIYPIVSEINKIRRIRVGFLNTHSIQYFAPLYCELNRSRDISVTVLYLSDYSIRGGADHGFGRIVKWDVDLLAGYEARFVRGAERRG